MREPIYFYPMKNSVYGNMTEKWVGGGLEFFLYYYYHFSEMHKNAHIDFHCAYVSSIHFVFIQVKARHHENKSV